MHNNPFLTNFASVLVFLALLLLGVHLTRKSCLPYPAVMALGGLVISLIPGITEIQMNPDIVMYVILPPILYHAAWFTSWPEFKKNIRPVSYLAFGLVFVTIVSVALIVKLVLPEMPWAVAFVLGAILSPPDAIAATVVCRRAKVSPRLLAILEGESLVNDAGALVAFRIGLTAVLTGAFTFNQLVVGLVIAALGGVIVGLVVGKIAAVLHNRVATDTFVSLGISLLVPFLAFLAAEYIHASGVLAVVAAGILVSRESPRVLTAETRVVAGSVWGVLILLLNAFAFTMVGLQAKIVIANTDGMDIGTLAVACLAALAAVVLSRFMFVFVTAKPATGSGFCERRKGMTYRHHLVVAWTGMRGAVSLAAVLSVPFVLTNGRPFPFRNELVTITFFVVLSSLVIESLTLPSLIKALKIQAEEETIEQHEIVTREFFAIVKHEINDVEHEVSAIVSDLSKNSLERCRELLNKLRGHGKIGEEVFRHHEFQLDLREMSLKQVQLDIA